MIPGCVGCGPPRSHFEGSVLVLIRDDQRLVKERLSLLVITGGKIQQQSVAGQKTPILQGITRHQRHRFFHHSSSPLEPRHIEKGIFRDGYSLCYIPRLHVVVEGAA